MLQRIIGLIIVLCGIAVGLWLGLVYMLYGGIMQCLDNWGTHNSMVAWGMVRALFFELGLLPGFVIVVLGITIVQSAE